MVDADAPSNGTPVGLPFLIIKEWHVLIRGEMQF